MSLKYESSLGCSVQFNFVSSERGLQQVAGLIARVEKGLRVTLVWVVFPDQESLLAAKKSAPFL